MIHIITGEYPPAPGGVADYTEMVAAHLAEAGETVHVWTGGSAPEETAGKVTVHRTAGRFAPSGLRRLDYALNAMPARRRLLIQWTPHSFGFRSLNLAFALWVWKRARVDQDRVELMIHEPFLAFWEGNRRQDIAAAMHRGMVSVLLHAASKVWVSIPAWEQRLRPWCFGRAVPFEWLPVPANITLPFSAGDETEARCVGHFGTFREDIGRLLQPAIGELLGSSDVRVVLAGHGSERFRERLIENFPGFAVRISAVGSFAPATLASCVSPCDVLLQPYPDGISTRRGTAMAALAAGLPTVSNRGKLSEDFWAESGAVALASAPDASQLAARTLELLPDQPRREELSRQARDLYGRRFSIRHTIAALLGIPSASASA